MNSRTTAANANTGFSATVSYKALIGVLSPVIGALFVAVVWIVTAQVRPVEQKADANADRLNRQELRILDRLNRIETKIDGLKR